MAATMHNVHRRRSLHVSGGFSLIELIAIMLIIALLAGAAVPTLSTLSASRTGMAARQCLRDITFARQRAIATGVVHWVVFSTGSKTWSILQENYASPGRAGASIITDLATGKPYTITLNTGDYVGVNFTSVTFGAGTEIGFNWLGKPYISDSTALASQGSVIFTTGSRVNVEVTTGYAAFVP